MSDVTTRSELTTVGFWRRTLPWLFQPRPPARSAAKLPPIDKVVETVGRETQSSE